MGDTPWERYAMGELPCGNFMARGPRGLAGMHYKDTYGPLGVGWDWATRNLAMHTPAV